MKLRQFILGTTFLLSLCAFAQTTQKGVVKEYNEKAQKTSLAGVELNVRSANSTVSDKNGNFSLNFLTLKAGDRIKVRNIKKDGFEVFNKEAMEQWNLNPNTPFTIVMCSSAKFKAICDKYYSSASKNYERQLNKERAAIEKLKADKQLKEEEYQKRLAEIQETYDRQLDNLDNYVDKFARIDLSELQKEEQEIIELVQQGEFDEAIARYEALNLKEKYRKGLTQVKEESDAIEKLQNKREADIKSNAELLSSIMRQVETLELANGKENIDKAIDLLRSVAEMDSTNVEILLETGDYIKNYLADYPSAMSYYQKALNSTLEKNGEAHPLTCKTYTCIGEVYIFSKEYATAMEYFNKALEQWKIINDPEHPNLAQLYNDLGVVNRAFGKYDDALEYYNKALAIWEDSMGKENIYVATVIHNIGAIYQGLENYNTALDYYTKAASMCEKIRGPQHPTVGYVYQSIGTIWYYLGDLPKTLEYSNKALAILEKAMSPDDPNKAIIYDNIGMFYTESGDYNKGLEYFRKSLDIKQKKFGDDNLHIAMSYSHIGMAYKNMGDADKAEYYISKALEIEKNKLAPDHHDIAISYINLGSIYSDKGEYEKSLESHQKGLDVLIKSVGNEHTDVAKAYNNIGSTYSELGDFPKSLEYYLKSLDINQKVLGENHPEVALSYNNIGHVYAKMRDYDKAMENLNKALSICEKASLNPESTCYSSVLRNINDVKSIINAGGKNQ